jgi:excisionase family DNA binding protein
MATIRNRESLLTTEEVAAFLNVSPATVRRLARIGELPALRVGRQLRFDRAEVVGVGHVSDAEDC